MSNFNPAILIPVYNHGKACMEVVKGLEPYCHSSGTKIILVDDGNGQETKSCLEQISSTYPDFVKLIVLEKNSGKGGAVKAGVKYAYENGITHVLQLDADGQHDITRCQFFFEKAKENPQAMICGYPKYDESAPGHRKKGRVFANIWCAIVSWESGIKDSMCGFRIYPVEKTHKFMTYHFFDLRMGFDIEILIRLIWTGMPYDFYSVKVTYPRDGISNFHVVKDNIRISWVFTKLCIGMILRSPILLWRKLFK